MVRVTHAAALAGQTMAMVAEITANQMDHKGILKRDLYRTCYKIELKIVRRRRVKLTNQLVSFNIGTQVNYSPLSAS